MHQTVFNGIRLIHSVRAGMCGLPKLHKHKHVSLYDQSYLWLGLTTDSISYQNSWIRC